MELVNIHDEEDPHLDVKRAHEGLASFKCEICRDMELLRIHTWPHLTIENISALQKATSAGCQYCRLLLSACNNYKQECISVEAADISVHLQTRLHSINEERNVLQVKLLFENQSNDDNTNPRYFEFELYMYEDGKYYPDFWLVDSYKATRAYASIPKACEQETHSCSSVIKRKSTSFAKLARSMQRNS